MIAACLLLALIIGVLAGRRPRAVLKALAGVDEMSGADFEYYCAGLLRDNGFHNVRVTKGSGDYGADILCEKQGLTYAVQCKCRSAVIGVQAVQEIYAAVRYYDCQAAAVLTNSAFSAAAKDLAEKTGVELWDRERLSGLISQALKPARLPKKEAGL